MNRTQTERPVYRRRGTDHLGFLGAKLRDLLGYATLAHELIQNADDAHATTSMSFDVGHEALVVDNDGQFTDCVHIDERECPLKRDAAHGRMCDFHRFQYVASSDKRDEPETTGAFGIGFTAVYQITDQPELISAGRHWIIREDRPEEQRIEECPGCPRCGADRLPGTRFILPWARDNGSALRQKLRVDAVPPDVGQQLLDELQRSIPLAMLFLKRLRRIEIRNDGRQVREFERDLDEASGALVISDGDERTLWHLVRSAFDEVAVELRNRHPGRIEAKRSSGVTVAVPEVAINDGVFCAFLPTQHRTGLPFHINADFFPTSNRKEIVLESDYQSEWNRAAIEAAAEALARDLEHVRDRVSPTQLWQLLQAMWQVSQDAESGSRDKALGSFWANASSRLKTAEIIYTESGTWAAGDEAYYLERKEETPAVPILEALGCQIVHENLRFAQNLLISEFVDVPVLSALAVAEALQRAGLNIRREPRGLPDYLQPDAAMTTLREELGILLAQYQSGRRLAKHDRQEAIDELGKYALAPARDGAFWPCNEVYQADDETRMLFQAILPTIPFLADLGGSSDVLHELCPKFDAAAAVSALSTLTHDQIRGAAEAGCFDPSRLLLWFAERHHELRGSPQLSRQLRDLPIFPSSGGPRPLSELSLPGDFTDPLGLADVIDLQALGHRRDFLRDLGAKELTFEQYAAQHLPQAFGSDEVSGQKRRQAVQLLASEFGRIQDDDDIRDALQASPLVECQDGSFQVPADVYFPTELIAETLGSTARLALIPSEHTESVRSFYRWLGVAERPRLSDVIGRIRAVVDARPNGAAIRTIALLFDHLGSRLGDKESAAEIGALRGMRWLPARGELDRWYNPSELFADFSIKHLFESQALFLDISQPILQRNVALIDLLGISKAPTTALVVDHLLHCASEGSVVHRDVYRWLNERAAEPAIGKLVGRACLMLLPEERYVAPSEVFWQEHPFGRFRHQLSSELRKYNDLFERLGVCERPDHRDALKVIEEVAEAFGVPNLRVDDETKAVLRGCWGMLETALENSEINQDEVAQLSERKVVCNVEGLLYRPSWMFFDDRAGLAAKLGPAVMNNAIERPQGAWRAMAAAGVRTLSQAIQSHLVECSDPADDDAILRRVHERRSELARVLDFQPGNLRVAMGRLEAIRYQAVIDLRIQYTLRAFGREHRAAVETVPAHYLRDDEVMYFVHRSGGPPWAAVARELAAILCPDIEPGQLASGIKEVLAAESLAEAEGVLDELGFPRLDVGESSRAAPPSLVDGLGGEFDITAPEPETGELPASETDEDDSAGTATAPSPATDLSEPAETATTDHPRSDEAPSARDGDRSVGAGRPRTRDAAETAAPRTRKGYSRLRSYVMPDRNGEEVPTDVDGHAKRTAVDEAGIKRVVEYEKEQNRIPRIMRHEHPGYDVESFNLDGEIERYIEVKSLTGDWGEFNAGLTDTQFKRAQELGDSYWLYVVERVQQEDFRIHRIQDPANKAGQFLFDSGWQAVVEADHQESSSAITE